MRRPESISWGVGSNDRMIHLDALQPFHNSPHRSAPLIETRLFSRAKPCRSAPMSSRSKLAIRRRSVPAGSFSPISNTSFARAAAWLIQKNAAHLLGSAEMKFRHIEDQRDTFPVRVLSGVMGVSPAGYYAWRGEPESPRKAANRTLLTEIRRVHTTHRGRYGAPRIHAALPGA